MSYMQKQIEYGQGYEIDTREGTWYVPVDACGLIPESVLDEEDQTRAKALVLDYIGVTDLDAIHYIDNAEGYWARLSAPGYMDCTDWGVYDTEADADEALTEMYGDE